MLRHRGTDVSGKPFDPATVQAVWEKAAISREHPLLKVDSLGALIWREGYGNANSKLGWEIDHILPVEAGGNDDLDNLQALQWKNHRDKDQPTAPKPALLKRDEPARLREALRLSHR
jgi:5-methylcytosine-specific restriction endonuclease McrA